jgi:hypothetical protein
MSRLKWTALSIGLLLALLAIFWSARRAIAQSPEERVISRINGLILRNQDKWKRIDTEQKGIETQCENRVNNIIDIKMDLEQETNDLREAVKLLTVGEK